MCTHRTAGRFGRLWTGWLYAAVASFTVIEVSGLVAEGPDATLTYFLRRRAGLLEPCRHSHLGRLVIVAFSAWLAAHLGWGKLGVAPRRPSCSRPTRR